CYHHQQLDQREPSTTHVQAPLQGGRGRNNSFTVSSQRGGEKSPPALIRSEVPPRPGSASSIRALLSPFRATGPLTSLLQQLLHVVLDGAGPDSVALLAQVQVVRHDCPGQVAVLVEELRADVLVDDVLAIIELRDDLVDLLDLGLEVVGLDLG